MRVAGIGKALPPNYYDQTTLLAALERIWATRPFNLARLRELHGKLEVGGRHLALPLEEYDRRRSWSEANEAWLGAALDLGERAVREALERAGVPPSEVSALIFVTVTGVSTPSLDARLMNRLSLPSHVKRTPIFGLGCVAGAAGITRAADHVRAFPGEVAVLLSVELCSLTLQREDLSVANLIASGLFGDGAAAAVVVGAERPERGPSIVATRSVFYPGTERVMGWDVSDEGFRIVLSAEVPEMVTRHMRQDVDAFLGSHKLSRRDVGIWICHAGGPKVLAAMQEALELPPGALDASWRNLREIGNVSSTSVLLVLAEALDSPPPAGTYGLMTAMGPGFCSELVLLRW